jgi:hypothetical protein
MKDSPRAEFYKQRRKGNLVILGVCTTFAAITYSYTIWNMKQDMLDVDALRATGKK